MKHFAMLLLITFVGTSRIGFAQSPVVELGTTVTGNQEQPRVIHIVPWQATESADDLRRYIYGEREALLQPVERHSFQRQLNMLDALRDPVDNSSNAVQNR